MVVVALVLLLVLVLLLLRLDEDSAAGHCEGRRFQFNRRAVHETPRVTPGVQLAVPTKTRSISELVVLRGGTRVVVVVVAAAAVVVVVEG